MSVLACDRGDCDEIMCHILILDHSRYICVDCCNELTEWRQTWAENVRPCDVRGLIEEFMRSSKGAYLPVTDSTRADTEAEFQRLIDRRRTE